MLLQTILIKIPMFFFWQKYGNAGNLTRRLCFKVGVLLICTATTGRKQAEIIFEIFIEFMWVRT
jgi:hypothetical protein